MEDYKFLFKVVLVGNAGVGKTCLVRRFTQGIFPPGQGATIGVDFMIKTVEVDNEKVKVIYFSPLRFYKSHFPVKYRSFCVILNPNSRYWIVICLDNTPNFFPVFYVSLNTT